MSTDSLQFVKSYARAGLSAFLCDGTVLSRARNKHAHSEICYVDWSLVFMENFQART